MGIFTMPSLGADMEAGTLVEWQKKPGDLVKRGDIIAVVETEKGAIEVEVFDDGPIAKLLVEPGTKVPVGTPLAVIGTEEVIPVPAPVPVPSEAAPEQVSTVGFEAPALVPAPASPAARKLARELGIIVADVKGTGPSGAVTLSDVEGAQRPSSADRMRKAIAAAMARSKREIPHYYLTHTFDASAARDHVDAFNADQPPEGRILLGALLMKAVALALRDYPEFNGFYGSDSRQESSAIHVGMAISMRGGGLVAPAIHNTDTLAVPELMLKMRDLVARVRAGGFRSSEISDSTVTVSSLGDRGVEALLPIIYPPQVAIVGFGTIEERPWVVQSAVISCPVLTVTLAADHRVSDGHRGALFLRRIDQLIQGPGVL